MTIDLMTFIASFGIYCMGTLFGFALSQYMNAKEKAEQKDGETR